MTSLALEVRLSTGGIVTIFNHFHTKNSPIPQMDNFDSNVDCELHLKAAESGDIRGFPAGTGVDLEGAGGRGVRTPKTNEACFTQDGGVC